MVLTKTFVWATTASLLGMAALPQAQQPRIDATTRDLYLVPGAGGNVFAGNNNDDRLATQADISTTTSSLESTISSLQSTIDQDLSLMRQQMVTPTCPILTAPANGTMTMPPELLPGVQITFSCDGTTMLSGDSTLYCLSNGSWSGTVPVCGQLPALGSQSRPGLSCKDIYLDRITNSGAPPSGAYYLQLRSGVAGSRNPIQVYCDMDTPSRDGASGWTICGKYDRDKADAPDRYLSYGFGRIPTAVSDMSDLATFTNPSQKWSSNDCRDIIRNGATYMMHAGTNNPSQALPFNDSDLQVRFTNILSDVREDPTNLFDTLIEDTGVCRSRATGAIRTFNSQWVELTTDGNGTLDALRGGTCLVGNGHHFCSFRREGSRLSNAGTNACRGSEGDSVYWAWDADEHGCNAFLRIGTGCDTNNDLGTPGIPSFRYNYLLLH